MQGPAALSATPGLPGGAQTLARAPSPSEEPLGASPQRRPGQAGSARRVGEVAVLLLFDAQPTARLWAWSRLVLGHWPLRDVPGLGFSKVLGSGADGGFGIAPSGTHQGLFLVFDDEPHARDFIDASPVLEAYREHARELCVVLLRACSSKGSWSGAAMDVSVGAPVNGPIAALTRASIRPTKARAFWKLSPPAEASLAVQPGCLLAAGLGEAPVLRQATFSLWSSAQAMDAYARTGAHQQAIAASYRGHYFSESMFVRFLPLEVRGVWQGQRHG